MFALHESDILPTIKGLKIIKISVREALLDL